MSNPLRFLLFLLLILCSGCGGSSFTNDITGQQQTPSDGKDSSFVARGSVVIESVLERRIRGQVVPGEAETLRFSGFTDSNEQVLWACGATEGTSDRT